MYQQYCNPCMRNGLQDECGNRLRQMSYSYDRRPGSCPTSFNVYSSRSVCSGRDRSLRERCEGPTDRSGRRSGRGSTRRDRKGDNDNEYTDSEPFTIPYRTTYYPAGPFGPRIELCPYVPITECA
ncbi:unnamed protein product [Hermetia illucens]|uniref:Uncharacterized protein n=1 Tax=Hermetia illucens TaxID=343691 RepID=A0A7R8YV83_HERIL|nr:uncharacterized protein LOC119651906 [Hermetia illucens]CAD7086059.1 unnamed protein product [Hermetia illucens]